MNIVAKGTEMYTLVARNTLVVLVYVYMISVIRATTAVAVLTGAAIAAPWTFLRRNGSWIVESENELCDDSCCSLGEAAFLHVI